MMRRRLIGAGLQYRVYDLGNRRVLKIPTTRSQKLLLLLRWGYLKPASTYKAMRWAETMARDSTEGLKSRSSAIDAAIFGNPSFGPELRYEQDKAVPLGVYFERHSLAENRKAIDLYIAHNFTLWSFGIGDVTFNFTTNHAIADKGEVSMIDVGELSFSKADMANCIEVATWLWQWSFRGLRDGNLKGYFQEAMAKAMTVANLEKHWNSRIAGASG
jgi:hypothetical protein